MLLKVKAMDLRKSSTGAGSATIEGLSFARPRAERRNLESRERLLARLRGEFREMPCLSLTFEQSMRLFGLREDVCRRLLHTMQEQGEIWRRNDGRYTARFAS